MSKSAVLSGALLLAAVAMLSACTSSTSGSPASPTSSASAEKKGPAGPVPSGLASFYGQPLSWGDCRSYETDSNAQQLFGAGGLQCARLTVPLDYASPGGRTITVAVLRYRGADPATRIGTLIVNPGGPGGSGTELAASMVKTWTGSDLAKHFDLVGFDPRGIGASQPIVRCLTGPEQDAVRASDLDDAVTQQGIARFQAQQQNYANRCVARTGDGKDMLANLGTRDVARDLDVLRSALGDPKLTYLGYSYGTRLGTTYAEQFPGNVRALVLDGAVDPNETVVDETVNQGRGFQTAFDQFAQWCAKQSSCAVGANPSQATQAFRELVNPLLDHPVPADDRRMLSYDDATTGAIQALYSQSYWSYLNDGLNELKQGTGHTLMALADVYDGRNPDGTYSTEQDAFNAVRCVDDPPVTDPNLQLQANQRYKQVAPFLDDGRPAVAQEDVCAIWPVAATGKPHLPSVPGLPPVLVVSTTNDPATPYQAGLNLANALHGGLLTFQGTQHTAYLQGIACVDRWGNDYLINLKLPPAGTTCAR